MTASSKLPPHPTERSGGVRTRLASLDQGYTVGAVVVFLVVLFALLLDGFLSPENLLGVALNSSVLGILAVGLAIVVLGRGIDLSIVVIMGMSAQLIVDLLLSGRSEAFALVAGLVVALTLSAINGILVAYVEIPALFVTLATSLLFVGCLRLLFLRDLSGRLPYDATALLEIARSDLAGVPIPAVILVVVVVLAHLFLSRTKLGRFIHAQGDNPAAARLSGIPTRPLTVMTYLLAGVMGFLAGVVSVGLAGGYDARALTGSQLYDVIAVVVIGGVSLAGGRGSVWGVLAGALLIGVLINGMTLLNFDTIQQSLWKAVIVLAALVLDSLLHPRDEEHARPGEL